MNVQLAQRETAILVDHFENVAREKRIQKEIFLKERADGISAKLQRVDELHNKMLEDQKDPKQLIKIIKKHEEVTKNMNKVIKEKEDCHTGKFLAIAEKK